MTTVCKSIFRWTLIGGLTLAGITVLIGPQRVAAVFNNIQTQAEQAIDTFVDADDARALRNQLQSLASEYPDRIGMLRTELSKVQAESSRFVREADVARRVVQMTDLDLESLAERVRTAEGNGIQQVALRAHGSTVDLDRAYREGRRIQSVRETYRERLVSDERQVEVLESQQVRLQELLDKLENEYADYRAQAWQLDRQIGAIQRNDRLIALTQQQQAVLRDFDAPGSMRNLRQIEDRLAEMRAVQEGMLLSLAETDRTQDYELLAAQAAGVGLVSTDPFVEFADPTTTPQHALPSLVLDARR